MFCVSKTILSLILFSLAGSNTHAANQKFATSIDLDRMEYTSYGPNIVRKEPMDLTQSCELITSPCNLGKLKKGEEIHLNKKQMAGCPFSSIHKDYSRSELNVAFVKFSNCTSESEEDTDSKKNEITPPENSPLNITKPNQDGTFFVETPPSVESKYVEFFLETTPVVEEAPLTFSDKIRKFLTCSCWKRETHEPEIIIDNTIEKILK